MPADLLAAVLILARADLDAKAMSIGNAVPPRLGLGISNFGVRKSPRRGPPLYPLLYPLFLWLSADSGGQACTLDTDGIGSIATVADGKRHGRTPMLFVGTEQHVALRG